MKITYTLLLLLLSYPALATGTKVSDITGQEVRDADGRSLDDYENRDLFDRDLEIDACKAEHGSQSPECQVEPDCIAYGHHGECTYRPEPPPLHPDDDYDGTGDKLGLHELFQDNFNLSCVDYGVSGICIWLKCNVYPPSCSVKQSVLVKHFVPDLLVEVTTTDKYPLQQMTEYTHTIAGNLAKLGLDGIEPGQGTQTSNKRVKNLQFHDVTMIGNPVAELVDQSFAAIAQASNILSWCKSPTTPFFPYYDSQLDLEWRYGLTERLLTLWPPNLSRVVGTTGAGGVMANAGALLNGELPSNLNEANQNADFWGYIYPRMGYVNGHDRYRTSATAAQRVADITTAPEIQTHIYTSPPSKPDISGKGWGYGQIREKSDSAGKWQLNFPRTRGDGCYTFPDGGASHIPSDTANYVWTLWRKFKCCEKKGQIFVTKIEW